MYVLVFEHGIESLFALKIYTTPSSQFGLLFFKTTKTVRNFQITQCCAIWRRAIYAYYPNLHLIMHSALLDMPYVISLACIAGMPFHDIVPP